MSTTADVAVVGAGAVGMTAALEIARAGARVTVLERGPAPGAGCSAGSAGLINVSHAAPIANPQSLRAGLAWAARRDSPFTLRPRLRLVPWLARFVRAALAPRRVAAASDVLSDLARAGHALHEQFAADGVPTGYQRRGIIYACERDASLESVWEDVSEVAPGAQLLNAAELSDIAPGLAPCLAGAVYCPREGHLDSLRYVEAVARAARDAGTTFRGSVEVLGFERAGRRIGSLRTTAGPLRVGEVVLAAGVWSRALARTLGSPLPLEGAKGYHVDVAGAGDDPAMPVYLHEARIVATPLEGRLRLAGSLELGGAPDTIDPRRVQAIVRAARARLPGIARRRPILGTWAGLRPCAPDGLPMLGRPERYDNLIVATGHAHLGIVLAPVTARIVAALVEHRDPGHRLGPMSPDRFLRPTIGSGGVRRTKATRAG